MSNDEFKEFREYEKYFTNNEGDKLFLAMEKPAILQNLYHFYDFLRSKGDKIWIPDKNLLVGGFYMVHDYDIINEVLKSKDAGVKNTYADLTDEKRKEIEKIAEKNPYYKMARRWMLFNDPPAQVKIRTLMNKVFTPGRLRELSDPILEITNSLIDNVPNDSPFDLLKGFAYPLPVLVIASLLGVPTDDLPTFKRWSANVFNTLGNNNDPNRLTETNQTVVEMRAFFKNLLTEREKNPLTDLISALAIEKNTEISEESIIDNLILLLVAGHETTMNLISNGTYHLLEHSDQLSLLKDNPELYPNAVEEAVRYDSPVQSTARWSYADLTFDNFTIKAGQHIHLMLASANRNESSNPNPNVFDITRKEIKQLSFGRGVHYCLGAPLAKLEGQIAFEALFNRFKNLQIVEQPVYRNNMIFRGFNSLILKN